ncbi:PIN-like domain-containing protein [Pseudomonas sp. PDM31]|uniref:PIN-like domain-containing protein n=1 Tax=Pseudomonas sp. PDM31 TaxID=2854778 RepID=UPI001C45EAC1|nr:PIN-like domain-containing protein [Pseudomonas sp. PDM31]MBV7478181.1 DUF4935 domain-containing protein [Pseudomonas sp. PDM31]
MKKEFPGYFSGAEADVEKMWDECVFVLDANVLLNLYRYSDFTCSKLLEVFKALGDRLWVPHQVVYEYLNNRLTVIGEVGKIYDDAVKKVDSLKKSLESHNQHPFVAAETLTESLSVFDRVVAELNQNKLVHEKRITLDEIKDQLEQLLEGKVGEGFTRDRLDSVIVDGKLRYEQKTPPGFCDAKKGGDSVVFSEICRPYGDYIVWLQIIDYAKSSNKPIIFITGDTKDDWWASFQGKTLGPHPQLVQEFLSLVEQDFYMYPPDRFLERANVYLKQDASDQAVNEIRDIREEATESGLLDKGIDIKFDFGRPFPFDANEARWYANQRSVFLQRALQTQERLSAMRTERDNLIELEHQLALSGTNESSRAGVSNKIGLLNSMIAALESEFSTLQEQMSLYTTQQKTLLEEKIRGKS